MPTKEMTEEEKKAAEVKPKAKTASEQVRLSSSVPDRWYRDKGSIPGEPVEYLDSTKDSVEDSKAAIIEHESAKGTKFEALTSDGKSLGTFDHIEQARTAAEKAFPKITKAAEGEVGREPGARPGTTRESKIGRNTKQAERVASKRAQAMRGKQAEEAEATARAQAKSVSVAHIQIPEAEEALQQLDPKGFSALQKFRRIKSLPDSEYLPALHEMLLRAYEKQK